MRPLTKRRRKKYGRRKNKTVRRLKGGNNGPEDIWRCPISHEIMWRPVVASDGYTYEEFYIMQVLNTTRISPMNRAQLKPQVYPNRLAKELIDDYLQKNPQYANEQFKLPKGADIIRKIRLHAKEDDDHNMYLTQEQRCTEDELATFINEAAAQDLNALDIFAYVIYNGGYSRNLISQLISKEGIDLNKIQNVSGQRPLYYMVRYFSGGYTNGFDLIKLAIEKGASVNIPNNDGKLGPFYTMVNYWAGAEALLILFLSSGLNKENMERRDNFGIRPIHLICLKWSYLQPLRLMVEHTQGDAQVNINAQTGTGLTPLMMIIDDVENEDIDEDDPYAHMDMVQYMLSLPQTNIELADVAGKRALHHFIQNRPNNMEGLQLLIDKGVDVKTKTNDGKSALYMLAETWVDNVDAFKLMVAKGANVHDMYRMTTIADVLKDKWSVNPLG